MESMLQQWWRTWQRRRPADLGPQGELFALARGSMQPISPSLAQWLERHGWEGDALSRADAERWA
eukprot:14334014-Alexandrium_andersonii.AAC.1